MSNDREIGTNEIKEHTVIIHRDRVERVSSALPEENDLYDFADFFRILGDSTRIRILYALKISEMCVWDLSHVVGISRSAVSHQLKILKQANLVRYRKEGKLVYYSVSDAHVSDFLEMGLIHIKE